MTRGVLFLALVAALAAPAAQAGNVPHPALDAAATQIAGKPVTVWCEANYADWDAVSALFGQPGWAIDGFTLMSDPVVYIHPSHCSTLQVALRDGVAHAGAFWFAIALLTLAHEAVHQRGVSDEQQADCIALPLVGPTATQHFGVPATITEKQTRKVTRTVTRRVKGVTVKLKVQDVIQVDVAVPNPMLGYLTAWATSWHAAYGPPC